MIKSKKKNLYTPLVITGYVLFSLLVVSALISSVIPLSNALSVPGVRYLNVTVMMVAFTIGLVLPMLLGYLIGDHAVKTKDRVRHHFTGILFGLLAYWIMTLLSMLIRLPEGFHQENLNASLFITNILPSIGVAIITVILSVAHMRSRSAKKDIIEYKPFVVALFVCIAAVPIWSLIDNIINNMVSFYSFLGIIVVAISAAIAYATLRSTNLSNYQKAVWSAISVSVLFVAMFIVPRIVSDISNYIIKTPTMEFYAVVSWIGFAVALAIWVIYWIKQVKALK